MEKRAIVAFGLSALLLFAYIWVQEKYFPSPTPTPKTERAVTPAPAPAPGPTPAPAPATTAKTPAAPETAAAPRAPSERPPQRTVPVEAPLFRAVVSSEGGKLQEWMLHYRGAKPMVVVGEMGPGGLGVGPADARRPEPVSMTVTPTDLKLQDTDARGDLVLQGQAEGLDVRETLTFTGGHFTIGVRLEVRNTSGTPRAVSIALPWTTREQWDGHEKFIGQRPTEVVWSSGGHIGRDAVTAIGDQVLEGEWIGLDSPYYLTALLPKAGGFKLGTYAEGRPQGKDAKGGGRVTIEARATATIRPGEAWTGEVLAFVGPKEYERLKALGLEGTVNFGGFPIPRKWGGLPMEWIGVPILLLMKWVYRVVGNYGIAIILLTVISKVLFYPLTVKSIRSMKSMQALQPQVNEIRTKYKSDPQRAQREMMDLYRRHKVNPAGGCLPMVAQIPIFYALYLALSVSVELQNASFLCFGRFFGTDLWICDLAAQDPTYVLPVLMGVTMFVQQKMSPTMGDPRQAKMMLVMPFVFTIMFVNLPSGLVLYWTVSNVLQILQQWYMDRPHARASREMKHAGRA